MIRPTASRFAALVAGCVLLAGCGDEIEIPEYDPPAEPSAGSWPTFAISGPAAVEVPPPPSPGSAEAQADERELKRIVAGRDLSQERSARFWAQEPAIRPWLDSALNATTLRKANDPVTAARAYALVAVAMNDAAVSAWRWKYRYDRKAPSVDPLLPRPKDPSYPSEHAAIAGAAERVLAYAFPERDAGTLEEMARRAGRSRTVAGVGYPSDVRAGLALGRKIGDAVVNRARQDGAGREGGSERPTGEGLWEPPPGSEDPPIQPLAGSWKPWILESGSRFRPDDPPAFDSAELRSEASRVVEVGEGLTAAQKGLANRWEGAAGTPQVPGIWNQIALSRIDQRGLSIPRVARTFALLNMSMADAGIASFDAKYTYNYPRPESAIADLGLEQGWKPFLPTPLSPSYVSSRSAFSAAAAELLAQVFPDSAKGFRRRADEAGASSVFAGAQFPFSDEAGRELGRQVGELAAGLAREKGGQP
ncbi:MAG: hypothetical protein ACR2GL_07830 [Thermoleophilaceae bacterium]